ncbi:invasion associated locus B family protein [Thalassobaculum sp. OXR-137]|uniref:invasion associated locus B family protein n=1 Tax=Thalassobaculum sp. OXR-137 TaxID=3100173 RepID=UPI002AC9671F|nr:invasion associated locus B family protein [Thalassobaculum sp. OXR-137]WPZ36129.1 invasion associated locus B family protein [Thalassobaculum sp. OXR-137]
MSWTTRAMMMALAVIGAMAAQPATAAEPERIGRNGDWTAFTLSRGGGKVCYMASSPTKAEGDYSARGEVFALVTHDPKAGIHDEVSIVTGYTYRKDSEVTVQIGGATFDMFTSGDRAWTQGPEEDGPLVQAMVRGADMVVKGVSSRGTLTTDTYSLSGFTATKALIDKACP